jgi:Flp pilus assembly protein TadG
MKSPHNRGARYGRNDGQVLVLFALFSLVLILFVGLGIDLGFAYVTKARLSKAIDASSLAAISNYDGGDPQHTNAFAAAKATFWANYGSNGVSGLATGQVTPTGNFFTDANGNLVYTNTVSTTINTYFLRVLPQWKTLTVGDTAVATRAPVVMTLVLDRSGSMDPFIPLVVCGDVTEGGKYLAGAATQFINIFDETLDQAAVVSFATTATTDLPMTKTFKTGAKNVPTIVNNLSWNGYTCSECGLTNALLIQNAVIAPNAVKVVVFFTDGQANTIHGTFNTFPYLFGLDEGPEPNCHNPNGPSNFYYTNGLGRARSQNFVCSSGSCQGAPGNCGSTTISVNTYINALGQSRFFCASQVVEDAMTNCVLLAQTMRANNNYVYSVGLTAQSALNPPDLAFLQSVANDPDGPSFDKTQPVGAAFQSTGQDLSQVFQQIAADIILRLVH